MTRVEGLEGKRVVLVGGAGFIGHHLALALARGGAEVFVIDNLQSESLLGRIPGRDRRERYLRVLMERLELLEQMKVKLYVQDARDYLSLGTLLTDTISPHVVVTLATRTHGVRSQEDPHGNFEHSLRTLENALDSSRNHPYHFIYLSTHRVYGNQDHDLVEEEAPLNPLGIDGAVKLIGEKMVIAYHQVFGLNYTIVRTCAVYGPRFLGHRLEQILLEEEDPAWRLRIVGDPQQRLDFTCVDDLVEGLCLVITRPEARNQVFNLTGGQPRRTARFAELVQQHLPGSTVEYLSDDGVLPRRGNLSIAKAQRLLGYQPRTSLEEGVARWLEWYRGLESPLRETVSP
jgi:nucleoside-diphosphate-sugar epimerase